MIIEFSFIGAASGRGGTLEKFPTAEMGKIVEEKWCYFRRIHFKQYFKIDKNAIFLWNFYEKFLNFSQKISNNCVFRLNCRKFNTELIKSFEDRL